MSKRAQRNAWFSELVGLGMSGADAGAAVNQSNFKAARNAYEYAKGVYSSARQSQAPAPPKAPDPIQPAPPPQKLGSDGGNRLKINKKSKRRRGQLSGGTTQQRINLNTSAFGGNTGGVGSVGGGG